MEHSPVNPAAPPVAPFLHQAMDSRLNHLNGEGVRELRKRLRGPPRDPRGCRGLGGLKSKHAGLAGRIHDSPNDA